MQSIAAKAPALGVELIVGPTRDLAEVERVIIGVASGGLWRDYDNHLVRRMLAHDNPITIQGRKGNCLACSLWEA